MSVYRNNPDAIRALVRPREVHRDVYIDDEVFELKKNEHTFIPVGAKHRIENPGEEILHIIEVQVGDYLGEDDIVRFEDIYGRSK